MKVTDWNRKEIQQVIDEAAQRAFSDESFMNLCLSDLPTALKEVVDGVPPKGMSIRLSEDQIIVQKENDAAMTFDIPVMLGENGELSDANLEAVAGGAKSQTISTKGTYNETTGWGGEVGYSVKF